MIFSSYIFVFLFLPICLFGFYVILNMNVTIFHSQTIKLGKHDVIKQGYFKGKIRKNMLLLMKMNFIKNFQKKDLLLTWLLMCSIVFYMSWKASDFYLLAFLVISNYVLSSFIKNRVFLLVLGVILNLSFLIYYKYAGFFLCFFNEQNETNILLPLGISFFTFQQIAYIIDLYRGKIKRQSFLNYALFVLFFPQIVAGPIVHFRQVTNQFENIEKKISWRRFWLGIMIFTIGLSKKVLVADYIGRHISDLYNFLKTSSEISFIDAWTATFGYGIQIYFDFSGYSDMALGLAFLFGITLPYNFNAPYTSTTISEFWRRWHITLSNFIKDYVYIPLGGSHVILSRTCLNLLLTMILAGLWHGVGLTFILWGGMHGLFLVIHRLWKFYVPSVALPNLASRLLTFCCVMLSWVLFRAESLSDACKIYSSLFNFSSSNYFLSNWVLSIIILLSMTLLYLPEISLVIRRYAFQPIFNPSFEIYAVIMLFVSCVLHLGDISNFIYFNF